MGVSTLVRLRPGAAWTMDRVARCTPLNSQTDTYRDRSAPNGTQRDPTAPNGTMIFLRPYLVEAAGADGPFWPILTNFDLIKSSANPVRESATSRLLFNVTLRSVTNTLRVTLWNSKSPRFTEVVTLVSFFCPLVCLPASRNCIELHEPYPDP